MIVTYPRTIQISHGVYDNVVDMHNMCTMIAQNLDTSEITNVYGGKTPWGFFNDKPEFTRFIDYVVQKHQTSNPFFNKKIGIIKIYLLILGVMKLKKEIALQCILIKIII
jgi:hypothetical protein